MVNRASSRRSTPRDEIVSRGIESQGRHNHPWQYSAHVKSGTRRTEKLTLTADNLRDLWGQIIASKARRREDMFAWNISKLLRAQRGSNSDY